MKPILILLQLQIVFSLLNSAFADEKVNSRGDTFVAALPLDWDVIPGSWKYFDVMDCFTSGQSCFGNNPTSPYGYPSFLNSTTQQEEMSFKMDPSEAVVIFLRTPPQVRYFGFSQYLFNRDGIEKPVFASLSDTLNHLKMTTTGSSQPVPNNFDQYAVIVWTADLNTLASIKQMLRQQGIPDSEINFIPIPIELPLNMGQTATSDTFSMLMRTALPAVPANYDLYMEEKPFYLVKVKPQTPAPLSPAPILGYGSEISGKTESTSLQTTTDLQDALNSLVEDIKENYINKFYLQDQVVKYTSKVGWDCINGNGQCNGDNHDALYSLDIPKTVKLQNSDLVIVAGVNHKKTGKALYLNHSVYDTVKLAGIVAVSDPSLTTGSALYHAGVTAPKDPRRLKYKNLYAYVISYKCEDLSYCLSIPAPTETNPVGLTPGAPFYLIGRSYVDPSTQVRPSSQEIIPHQVILARQK